MFYYKKYFTENRAKTAILNLLLPRIHLSKAIM